MVTHIKQKIQEYLSLGIILISLVLLSIFLPLLYGNVSKVRAASFTVCASGCSYTSIQSALNAASANDSIEVYAGTYTENITVSTSSIHLYGTAASNTADIILDGTIFVDSITSGTISHMKISDTDATGGTAATVSSTSGFTLSDIIFVAGTSTQGGISFQGTIASSLFTQIDFQSFSTSSNIYLVYLEPNGVVSSTTFSDNTFGSSGKDMSADGTGATTTWNNVTIINNTFDGAVPDSAFNIIELPHVVSNVTITSNTFTGNYDVPTRGADDGAKLFSPVQNTVQIFDYDTLTITSNTFYRPSYGSPSSSSPAILNLFDIATGTFDNIVFSNNTMFDDVTSTRLFSISPNDNSGATSITTTIKHNVYLGSGVGSVIGQCALSGFDGVNLTLDYNVIYGHAGAIDIFSSSSTCAFGSNDITDTSITSGLFKSTVTSSADFLHLIPYSRFLANGEGGAHRGRYADTRDTVFNIDDDGTIDYSTVDATSTALVSSHFLTGDTLSFAAGTYPVLTVSSTAVTSSFTVSGVGATTIFDAGATTTASVLEFSNISTLTIQNLVVQTASSTNNTYTLDNAIYSFDGENYDETSNIGQPADNLTDFFNGTSNCQTDIAAIAADNTDVTTYEGIGTEDIHLALIENPVPSALITVFVPNSAAANRAAFDALTNCPYPDAWVTSTFSLSGSTYTYDAAAVSAAGITMKTGYTDPPGLEKTVNTYAGIKLNGVTSATIESVTSTNNGYGVWFGAGTSLSTMNSSTISSSVSYDIYSDATSDNTVKNTSFTVASSSIASTGNVDVSYKARVLTTSTVGLVEGATVVATRADTSASTTLTTAGTGYSPYADFLLAFSMTSSSIATTNGGYNPWSFVAAATSTFAEKTVTSTLNTQDQTVTITMVSNSSPTVSAISPSFATDATGVVTVTTTVTDADDDTVSLLIEHSLDGGSTWASSTLGTVSAGSGSPSTSTASVTGITSTSGGNALTFTWDTQADSVGTTTTAKLRIIPNDTTVDGTTVSSSNFTVDNTAPSAPSPSIAIASTTLTISWDAVSGASTYTVSTTADTATTTASVSVAYASLAPNTEYSFQTLATDAYGNASSYSTATSSYTEPANPGTPSASSGGQTSMLVSWSASSNGTGTVFQLYNVTTGAVVATTTATSYTVTGLTAGTSYQFKVRAQYLSDTATYSAYSSNSTAVSTTSAPASNSGSTAPSAPPPAPPATTAPPSQVLTVAPNTPTVVSVGNVSHTVTVSAPASNGAVTIVIQSDPITITLLPGEEQLVDTNKDGKDDLFVRLEKGNTVGKLSSLTIASIDDLELSINRAFSKTTNQTVTLYFNSPSAALMAISNDPQFVGASYVPYTKTVSWKLRPGNGTKTVYVKFRSAAGGEKSISDTITLAGQTTPKEDIVQQPNETIVEDENACALLRAKSYKTASSNAVYFVDYANTIEGKLDESIPCSKRAFTRSQIFFTYFTSWNDVNVVENTVLHAIPNDALTFMPLGPLYDPQYGALVKIVSDPKVYLLLNDTKYWITNETVFTTLNYAWNWIEDISVDLLNKYTTGSEITDTTRHPNYTLIKYENDSAIYRIEPSKTIPDTIVKRHIKDEQAFNKLGFRWDRIVTVPESEVYVDGEVLE